MFDIQKLSSRYDVRRMRDSDAEEILRLCRGNMQFYRHCGKQPSTALVLDDLHIAPPGKDASSKYYVGFYEGATLVAVMDLIDGYPTAGCGYIGFFMVDRQRQGRQIGSGIVREVCQYLTEAGFAAVRLAIDMGNPQARHFWQKNGFRVVKEVDRDGWPVLVAERTL